MKKWNLIQLKPPPPLPRPHMFSVQLRLPRTGKLILKMRSMRSPPIPKLWNNLYLLQSLILTLTINALHYPNIPVRQPPSTSLLTPLLSRFSQQILTAEFSQTSSPSKSAPHTPLLARPSLDWEIENQDVFHPESSPYSTPFIQSLDSRPTLEAELDIEDQGPRPRQ